MKIFKGNSGNSVLLSLVKAFTIISGILSTMIMSHVLSLEVYGTFSQLNLIVTTASNLTALGLVDAVNYFYNSSQNIKSKKNFTNTIIGYQFIIGIITAITIIFLSEELVNYFNNPMISSFIWLIAFRPLFVNLNASLQYLQIAIGKAKNVAIRNLGFAILRIIVYSVAALFMHDITIVLIAFLFFEVVVTLFFGWNFVKYEFAINPFRIDWSKVGDICWYSIPMGVYVSTNSLCRDVDKMIVGGHYNTDKFAIYANCSTLLPFDVVSASFLIVLVPILTRYFKEQNYTSGRVLFKNYLRIGYYTAFTFTMICMILSDEVILLLYGSKYLYGKNIFLLYTMVDMIKFANMSIVLSASGRTMSLMVCSLLSLLGNIVCNILFLQLFGFVGPALATVFITFLLTFVLTEMSANALKTSIWRLIEWKEFLVFVGNLVIVGFICYTLKKYFITIGIDSTPRLFLIGTLNIISITLMNKYNIIKSIKEINALK